MAVEFVTINHDTPYLLPPSIQDYLPEEHLARFVVEIVDLLDMRGILGVYAGKGGHRWPPCVSGTFPRRLHRSTPEAHRRSVVWSIGDRQRDQSRSCLQESLL